MGLMKKTENDTDVDGPSSCITAEPDDCFPNFNTQSGGTYAVPVHPNCLLEACTIKCRHLDTLGYAQRINEVGVDVAV